MHAPRQRERRAELLAEQALRRRLDRDWQQREQSDEDGEGEDAVADEDQCLEGQLRLSTRGLERKMSDGQGGCCCSREGLRRCVATTERPKAERERVRTRCS